MKIHSRIKALIHQRTSEVREALEKDQKEFSSEDRITHNLIERINICSENYEVVKLLVIDILNRAGVKNELAKMSSSEKFDRFAPSMLKACSVCYSKALDALVFIMSAQNKDNHYGIKADFTGGDSCGEKTWYPEDNYRPASPDEVDLFLSEWEKSLTDVKWEKFLEKISSWTNGKNVTADFIGALIPEKTLKELKN